MLLTEDTGSELLQNVGILPHHYTVSQPSRPWLEWFIFHQANITCFRIAVFEIHGILKWSELKNQIMKY